MTFNLYLTNVNQMLVLTENIAQLCTHYMYTPTARSNSYYHLSSAGMVQ